MALHLIKLSVGTSSLQNLLKWQAQEQYQSPDGVSVIKHITRNFPKKQTELLDGGSLYWVVKGKIVARNPFYAFDELADEKGKRLCGIVLKMPCIVTEPRAHRPFQGWRYFDQSRVPQDAPKNGQHSMDDTLMLAELKDLGLL